MLEPPTARRRAWRCTMAAENCSAAGGGAPWELPGESLLGDSVCTGSGGVEVVQGIPADLAGESLRGVWGVGWVGRHSMA